MAAKCAHCGEALRPHSMFCLSCGQLVAQSAPPSSPPFSDTNTQSPAPKVAAFVPPVVQAPAVPIAAPPVGPGHQPVPVAERRESQFAIQASSGETFTVTGQALVGRRPESASEQEGVPGFALDDDTRSVSRVHVHLNAVDGRLWVTDRGSGNGTQIERRGVRIDCPSGTPVAAGAGDRIWIGEVSLYVMITVG